MKVKNKEISENAEDYKQKYKDLEFRYKEKVSQLARDKLDLIHKLSMKKN